MWPMGLLLSIDRSERICTLCNKHEMGDEFHYLFYCSHFTQARCRFLPQQLIDCPNTITYSALMNCKDKFTVIGLAKFIKIVMSVFK